MSSLIIIIFFFGKKGVGTVVERNAHASCVLFFCVCSEGCGRRRTAKKGATILISQSVNSRLEKEERERGRCSRDWRHFRERERRGGGGRLKPTHDEEISSRIQKVALAIFIILASSFILPWSQGRCVRRAKEIMSLDNREEEEATK